MKGPFRSNQRIFCVCLTPAERGAAPGQPFRADAQRETSEIQRDVSKRFGFLKNRTV